MKNISIKEYTELANASKYDYILEHLKPVNDFGGKAMDINSMPYSNVKYCMKLLSAVGDWETARQLFEICFDVNDFWSRPVTEFFQAKKYLVGAFKTTVENEAKLLASSSTDAHLWSMAGADKLKQFNDILPLIQLGKQMGQYPFDLGRKPYGEILNLIVATKVQNEVEIEYQKLTMKK